ncbi:hypothetical protein MRB53_000520 [Persea americana]|uniref:Uncharacterized protein n=1 Tax=Persea americana TaxID=3435 RepID=A0ACC2MP47_PERAE|nr:hypothetical protein MRB53_000520 [Persea americana]
MLIDFIDGSKPEIAPVAASMRVVSPTGIIPQRTTERGKAPTTKLHKLESVEAGNTDTAFRLYILFS